MFTGIIESLGTVKNIVEEGTNFHFTISSPISPELKVDQSIAHNGVCLTVTELTEETYTVTAILETMNKTNLKDLKVGDSVNLERAMRMNARLDGHIVQGHVDMPGTCVKKEEVDGSWFFTFRYLPSEKYILVDKGSVCVNGVSLTVINPIDDLFSVAIIPFTYEHTNFKDIEPGTAINLEFDIIGKYISRYAELYKK